MEVGLSVSEKLAAELVSLDIDRLPTAVMERAQAILLDVTALCVAAPTSH